MEKDFDAWNEKKIEIQNKRKIVYFTEREVWWCYLGINIGLEEDGKGALFSRPILIFKKFNQECCLGIPISTTQRNGKYYVGFGSVTGMKSSKALISQIRLIDVKRLTSKIGSIDVSSFNQINRDFIEYCLPDIFDL